MDIINTPAELAAITDPTLCPILERFADLMDLAIIFIPGPGDTLASIEQARGWPFQDWEFIHNHPGDWFEAVFIISDDGAGHVVLVPDSPGVDTGLLALCRAHATTPDDTVDL